MTSSAGPVFRSASAIVCRPATASHVLRIDGYTHLSQVIGNGHSVFSSLFHAGGHSWRLMLCPNGDAIYKDHVSVFLSLQSSPYPWDGHVWARPQFSLLDRLGNPCHVLQTRAFKFTPHEPTWGLADFISRGELEKSEYYQDDCFAVQCDVSIPVLRGCRDDMVFITRNMKSAAS
ncbi:hypothetical protein QOZ80_6BG0470180 [Eleusine coracana subsp. coracana]|nr:hypothetical protein QOZ80_6BG0470180 [Eleusine coracana subsp. coracana]